MRFDIDCVVPLAYSECRPKAVHSVVALKERTNLRKVGALKILRLTCKSNHVERG